MLIIRSQCLSPTRYTEFEQVFSKLVEMLQASLKKMCIVLSEQHGPNNTWPNLIYTILDKFIVVPCNNRFKTSVSVGNLIYKARDMIKSTLYGTKRASKRLPCVQHRRQSLNWLHRHDFAFLPLFPFYETANH